jgi:DNA-binding GntR family transcriptional regulator
MGAIDQSPARTRAQQWSGSKSLSRTKPAPTTPLILRKVLRPLVGDSHRRASVDIHQYLRNSILANTLPPDTILSQVEVARCLKVSRTPVREAFRMLQEEGLISAEPNFRCWVLGFDPEELELLYVSRIINEGISAAITVENMKDADIEKLHAVFTDMRKAEESRNFSEWIKNHRAFHRILFSGANPRLQHRMHVDLHRSERYIHNSKQSGLAELFRRAAAEHKEILRACERRHSAVVAALLIRHLARAGIEILNALAPHWEAMTLRTAAEFMLLGAARLDNRRKCSRGVKKKREFTRQTISAW